MSKQPTVSIVSVTYNQEEFIGQTLEGFLAQQTDFDFEIVIADDCSSDSTPKIIRQYARQYPDIFKPILREANVGVMENFWGVMRAARGTYIALCEGDDYWTDPQKLQLQVDFLNSHPECALCFHPVKVAVESGREKDYISPDPKDKQDFSTPELLRRNFIQTNSVMYRRQTYDELPKHIMPVDWYLHMYHARFGEIGFIDRVMSVYRRHAGGVWAESYQHLDKVLQKYGVAWLGMHTEAWHLYQQPATYRKIIEGSIITMLNRLVAVDSKHEGKLLRSALAEFPEAGEIFIHDLIKQAKALDKHSREQAVIIDHYTRLARELESEKLAAENQNRQLEAKLLVRLEGAVKKRIKRRRN